MNLMLIGFFGLIGIFCRYGIDRSLENLSWDFPLSTFSINILGSFWAGVIFAFGERQEISPLLQTGLLVGFCGGFTTFSAYALQTLTMVDKGRVLPALAYWAGSPILGFAAAYTSLFLTRKFLG